MDLGSKQREFLQKLVNNGGFIWVEKPLSPEECYVGHQLVIADCIVCVGADIRVLVGEIPRASDGRPPHIAIKEKGHAWLHELIAVANARDEKARQNRFWYKLTHHPLVIAVVASVITVVCTLLMQQLWFSQNREPDPVEFELRAPELVWDRDCWAVAGDVVATGKIAPVMHVTLSYDWKGRKNGQEGWIGVTVRDGVGKLKARLPHHTDKEAAPRLQFALHSWQPAYGGKFEVTGGE